MTLAGCKRRKSLAPAIDYFTRLVNELEQVTYRPGPEEVTFGTCEPTCIPRLEDGEVRAGTWYLSQPDLPTEDRVSPSHRAELIHDPTNQGDEETDWIHAQPRAFRRLYYKLKCATPCDLPDLKQKLLDTPDGAWSHSQLTVLWDAYHTRRDFLRRRQETIARPSLSPTARKLIRRISRVRSRAELGCVGKNLYRSMEGALRLPGPVTPPEWGVVFAAYRVKKSEILSVTC
jgi:hypothetical protein